ncbi:polysaccharide biosynthesis tyrosine autokinase [Alphaproteobacteria bacterium KMM 3653]|uniref:Polysaccharide biosynthesis tyrosine autokinase n=1 Tax=Harenicola maris TaxID=2841044 RepID=A0AAP2CQJ2_9RHOB|nr:polysaccharide biosynthesis tyrosine autokinase [Harenicola maris]
MNSRSPFSALEATQLELDPIAPPNLRRALRLLWTGKLTVMLCMFLCFVAAGYYAFFVASPRFAAQTTLQVQTGGAPAFDLERIATGIPAEQAAMNTQKAVLGSRALMEQVVDDLNLMEDPRFNRLLQPEAPNSLRGLRGKLRRAITGEAAPDTTSPALQREGTIDTLSRAITVTSERDSYVLHLRAETGSPESAARIVNALAAAYTAAQVAEKQERTEAAVTWLAERVVEQQIELEAKETLANRRAAQTAARYAVGLEALTQNAGLVEGDLLTSEAGLARARDRLASFDDALAAGDADTVAAVAGDATLSRLLRGPGGADNARVTEQAALVRKDLVAEVQRESRNVAGLSARRALLREEIDSQTIDRMETAQLQREATATRGLYESLLAQYQEARIQRGLHQPDARILTVAAPGRYVAPRKMLILGVALLIGLGLGIALVLLREGLSNTLRSTAELEEAVHPGLGAVVLGQIPFVRGLGRGRFAPSVAKRATEGAFAEAVRGLRTSVLLEGGGPQVTMFTASHRGEGVRTLASALAHNLSGLGRGPVALIEANLRAPRLAASLGQGEHPGLADYLAGNWGLEDVVMHDTALGADLIPAGEAKGNPADLLTDARFASFVAQMRKAYDQIIIIAPPALRLPDARLVAAQADAMIYCARWNRATAADVNAGLRCMGPSFAGRPEALLGLVMTAANQRQMRRLGLGASAGGYAAAPYWARG